MKIDFLYFVCYNSTKLVAFKVKGKFIWIKPASESPEIAADGPKIQDKYGDPEQKSNCLINNARYAGV